MEYAVIETSGRQYRVSAGDMIEIDGLKSENSSVSFEKVLLHVTDSGIKIGKPYISGLQVTGKILSSGRGNKIRVARFTAKSRHRRVVGFRPSLSKVQIQNIVSTGSAKTVKTPSGKKAK